MNRVPQYAPIANRSNVTPVNPPLADAALTQAAQPDQLPPSPSLFQAAFANCERIAALMPERVRDPRFVTVAAGGMSAVGGILFVNGQYIATGLMGGGACILAGAHIFAQVFYPPHIFR